MTTAAGHSVRTWAWNAVPSWISVRIEPRRGDAPALQPELWEQARENVDCDGFAQRQPRARSSPRSPPRASRASRSSRTTCCPSTARRPTCASWCADLGLEIIAFQPFRDFEGMPADKRERVFARAERKFDLMQELGCDLLLVCSNVSPDCARRHRPRRRRPPRAGRARRAGAACASASRRWPGAATSTTIATPGRWCAAPTIRPSAWCSTASTRWRARRRLSADPLDPGRPHLPGADGRRAGARHGRAVLEPAFPQLPRPGRPSRWSISSRRCRPPASTARCRSRSSTTSSGPARPAASPSTATARCIYLMDQLRARTGRTRDRRLPALPPRSTCLGTEFIEFAIDENTAPAFEALLQGPGLRRAPACTCRRR